MHYPQLTWSGVGILLKLWKKCEPCTLVKVGWRECSLCAVTTKAMRLERTTISPTKFLKPKRHSVNHIWKFLTVLRFTHVMMSLLCAMCCRSTASGPCSCSGEDAAPVMWSKSSSRTTEGCLQTACSKTFSSLCLIVSALLPSKCIESRNMTNVTM